MNPFPGFGSLAFGAGNAPLLHTTLQGLAAVPDSELAGALSQVEVALFSKVEISFWGPVVDRVDSLLAGSSQSFL